MNIKTVILVFLVFSVFLVGCSKSGTNGYSAYNQPQGQQQGGQYVGGGCGVAPSAAYEDTPVQALGSKGTGL